TNMIGSRGMIDNIPEWAFNREDKSGRTLKGVIEQQGGRPDLIKAEARKEKDISLYLELHIEQGPILEQTHTKLAAITGIVGAHRYYVTVEGKQNHVGGSPMHMRYDALTGASEM